SKTDDLDKAYSQVHSGYDKYLGSVLISGSYNADRTKDDLEESKDKYKEALDALKDAKALKDSEAKEKYDEVVKASDEFLSEVEDTLGLHDDLTGDACSKKSVSTLDFKKQSTISDQYNTLISNCLDTLDKLSNAKSKAMSEYFKKTKALYDEQKSLFAEVQSAYNKKDKVKYLAALSRIKAQSRDFLGLSAKIKDVKSDMLEDDTDKSIEEMQDYLNSKK
ncbi:hypothetical protein CR956_01865, partial [Candidatus Saccharibacteria bacterium]